MTFDVTGDGVSATSVVGYLFMGEPLYTPVVLGGVRVHVYPSVVLPLYGGVSEPELTLAIPPGTRGAVVAAQAFLQKNTGRWMSSNGLLLEIR